MRNSKSNKSSVTGSFAKFAFVTMIAIMFCLAVLFIGLTYVETEAGANILYGRIFPSAVLISLLGILIILPTNKGQ
ncbi:MAG: hypothetical protein NUV64_02290 [Parcubacteria group bacterium]|nr:hypothetical protein [Parcubacteria group bacterium]MCR4342853.1 hypothetical protein [Patescibacteria group bacterium]